MGKIPSKKQCTQCKKTNLSKLKSDCLFYVHTNHAITACVFDSDKPHIFESYTKCEGCPNYKSSNKGRKGVL